MPDTLRQCELDVEQARQKLSGDLAILRSPGTLSAFTADLKHEAMETKDELFAQAKQAVESRVSGMVEDLKAKAAANPAAVLMIGGGLGWYLLRHPPITTALVGCGLFSLLRTPAVARPNAQTQDYLRQGQARLQEQARDLAMRSAQAASAMATDAGEKIAATTGELFDSAKDTATRLSHDARDQVAGTASAVRGQVESIIAKAGGVAADLGGEVKDQAGRVSERVSAGFGQATSAVNEAVPDEARDRILLGVAGLAVAAAFGFACQKRFTDEP